jgi:zinc/manganese transport system substrate-binding protein
MKSLLIGATLVSLLATVPCQAKVLKVVASFSILADVVKQVGGDHVEVTSLVPPNGDPHEFEPSPDHARALKTADLAFISGHGLETWFNRLARAAGYRDAPVTVSKAIHTLQMDGEGRIVPDPHVWNDPKNVLAWTDAIRDALVAKDAEDANDFRENAATYADKLKTADRYAHERIDPISPARRKILTSHDAFGYFGRAYDVKFLAPIGYSTETEPSAASVAKLIDQIRREDIKVFFFENSSDTRLVKQIAAATGAISGGTLYVESLSAKDGPAPTYLAMFRHNVDRLADAMAK